MSRGWQDGLEIVARWAADHAVSWEDFGTACKDMYYTLALERCDGNKTRAARCLGIGRSSFNRTVKGRRLRIRHGS